jgi:hypothetical protein
LRSSQINSTGDPLERESEELDDNRADVEQAGADFADEGVPDAPKQSRVHSARTNEHNRVLAAGHSGTHRAKNVLYAVQHFGWEGEQYQFDH